jgi:hypothetical protein
MDFLKKFSGGNKAQQPVGAGGQPAGQKDDYVDKSKFIQSTLPLHTGRVSLSLSLSLLHSTDPPALGCDG